MSLSNKQNATLTTHLKQMNVRIHQTYSAHRDDTWETSALKSLVTCSDSLDKLHNFVLAFMKQYQEAKLDVEDIHSYIKKTAYKKVTNELGTTNNLYQFDIICANEGDCKKIYPILECYFGNANMKGLKTNLNMVSIIADASNINTNELDACLAITMFHLIYIQMKQENVEQLLKKPYKKHYADLLINVYDTTIYCDTTVIEYVVY